MKEDGKYYWQIGETMTDEPVMSDIQFKVDATGKLLYSTNGTDWNVLDIVDSSNPDVAKTDIVFAESINADENTWVEPSSASEANWIGIKYNDTDIVWMPTYKNFVALTNRLTALETEVGVIKQTVATQATTLESLNALNGDVQKLLADVATLKTLKFIGTPVQTENGWTIPVTDGAGAQLPNETITITNGKDGAPGTIVSVMAGEDGKMYWALNGEITEYPVTGNDGADAREPIFQINQDGKLQYRFSSEEEWTVLDKVVGDNGAPGTPGEDGKDGAVNVVFASSVIV
jgi:hypothetical protein